MLMAHLLEMHVYALRGAYALWRGLWLASSHGPRAQLIVEEGANAIPKLAYAATVPKKNEQSYWEGSAIFVRGRIENVWAWLGSTMGSIQMSALDYTALQSWGKTHLRVVRELQAEMPSASASTPNILLP